MNFSYHDYAAYFDERIDEPDNKRDNNPGNKGNGHSRPTAVAPIIQSAQSLRKKVFEPARFVVPSYITEGLTILAGRPKLGKSWLMLDIGLAVGRGGCWGNAKCDAGNVLYLALE